MVSQQDHQKRGSHANSYKLSQISKDDSAAVARAMPCSLQLGVYDAKSARSGFPWRSKMQLPSSTLLDGGAHMIFAFAGPHNCGCPFGFPSTLPR